MQQFYQPPQVASGSGGTGGAEYMQVKSRKKYAVTKELGFLKVCATWTSNDTYTRWDRCALNG